MKLRPLLSIFFLLVLILPVRAQDRAVENTKPNPANRNSLSVTPLGATLTAGQLVESILGEGVSFQNVVYTGSSNAAGVFSNGTQAGLSIVQGIILSSGSAAGAIGPNNNSGYSVSNGTAGDADLSALINGATTNDASILEFDFIPVSEEISFNFILGSEEYPEFLNFHDVFGFFVNGTNIALLPGTNTPIAINTVNHLTNSQYYISNTPAVYDIQCDGFTTTFAVTATVSPGVINHIKLAVADMGDSALDTWVFLEQGSFISGSDLSIQLTPPNEFIPGESHVYQLQVNNSGPSIAQNVTALLRIPYEFVNYSIDTETGSYYIDNHRIVWSLGNLPIGIYTMQIEVTNLSIESLNFAGSVYSDSFDPATTNNYFPDYSSPIAVNDYYEVLEDQLLSIPFWQGVMVNDRTFSINTPLSYIDTYPNPEAYIAFDIDGSFEYLPYQDFNGVDSFWYYVYDGGFSSLAQVTINVIPVNDPPEIYLPQELSFWQGDSYWFDIRSTYYDIDSDDLSLTFSGNSNISVELSGDYAVFSSQNWSGTESITFTVTDDEGLSASDTIAVTVIAPKSCYDLNYTTNPNGNSPFMGQTVAVSGVVTAVDLPNNNFFVSDPSGGAYSGLLVYSNYQPAIGDLILAKGHLNELTGVTNLSGLNYIHVLQQNFPLPAPALVTPEDVFLEAWESCLIKVENLVCRTPLGSPDVFEAKGASASVMVSDWLYPAGHTWTNVGYGQSFESITGIMDHYGYEAQLLPRSDADIAFSAYYTCAQIQYPAPGSTDSPYLGQVVTVQGIITARPENRMIMWIGDPEGGPWSGLLIHTGITTGQIGDLVRITGTVEEFGGQTELDFVTSIQVIAANQQLPPAWTVDLAELNGDNAEMYEGVLLTIQKVSIVESPPENYIFMVSNTSNSIRVSSRLYPLGTEWEHMDPGNDFREITGILDYYYNTYRVCPRNDDDIIELNEYVWVHNASHSSLQILDTADNQILDVSWPISYSLPEGLDFAVSPRNDFMLLTSFSGNEVYHFDISNPFYPAPIATYSLGWPAEDVALSQDGRFAVISDGGNSTNIGLIDLQSRAVVQTIDIYPRYAQCIDLSSDGKVLVGDYNNSRVYQYLLDADTGTLVDSGLAIQISENLFNISIHPGGSFALIATVSNGYVFKLNNDNSMSLIQTIPTGGSQSAIYSPDGERAFFHKLYSPNAVKDYTVNSDGILSLANNHAIGTNHSNGYYGVDVIASNYNGTKVYAGHCSTPTNNLLYAINTQTSTVTPIQAQSPTALHIANLPLNALFSAKDPVVETGNAVRFIQYSSGGPETFLWNFGDGNSSTERHPVHVYTAPGIYTVSLQVQRGSFVSTIQKDAYIEVFTNINASIRYVNTDSDSYLPGAVVNITQEIDTALSQQTVWIHTSLVNSEGIEIAQAASEHFVQAAEDDPAIAQLTIPITVSPGAYEILTVVYDASGTVEQDRLTVSIEVLDPVPELWFTPDALNFGQCYATDHYQASVTLGNSGHSVLLISDMNVSVAGFTVEPAELSIAPGESVEAQITFSPVNAGQVNAVFTGNTNVPELLSFSIPVAAVVLMYPSPVYHSVSPNPVTPEYLSELGVLVSISFADTMIVDASSIQYRYDKNGNGVYDAAEVWQSVSAGEDATEITVQQLLSFRRDGDHFAYEFRAQNMRHSGYTYTGFQSAEGIADDFYVMIDATPPLWIDELLVDGVGDNSVSLSWSESFDPRFAGYEIYYATQPYLGDSDICWNYLNDPALGQLSTTQTVVTGLNPGTTYYFAIRARDTLNNISEFSDEVSATTTGLSTSIALHIQLSGGVGMLSWDAYPGASAYNIYRASSPYGPWQSIGQTTNTQYEIELTEDKAFFNIRAVTPPAKASLGERK